MAASLQALAKTYRKAREHNDRALHELRAGVTAAIEAGEINENEAAKVTGVSRTTIRSWLGKNPQR